MSSDNITYSMPTIVLYKVVASAIVLKVSLIPHFIKMTSKNQSNSYMWNITSLPPIKQSFSL